MGWVVLRMERISSAERISIWMERAVSGPRGPVSRIPVGGVPYRGAIYIGITRVVCVTDLVGRKSCLRSWMMVSSVVALAPAGMLPMLIRKISGELSCSKRPAGRRRLTAS